MRNSVKRRAYRPTLETFEKRDLPTLGFVGLTFEGFEAINRHGLLRGSHSRADIAARGGDPFADLSLIRRNSLKPGDVLVSTENGFVSGAIRSATSSAYSHAALYIGDGKIIDATSPGVRVRNLSDLTEPAVRVSVIRPVGLTTPQQNQIVDTAKSLVGKSYNSMSLATGVIAELSPLYRLYRRFWGSGRYGMAGLVGSGYFCSELVIKAYKNAGLTIAPQAADSPSTIIKYTAERPSEFEFVGRLPVGKG